MAQLAGTPKATKAPATSPGRPARADKGSQASSQAPSAKAQAATGTDTPGAAAPSGSRVDGPNGPRAAAPDSKADGPGDAKTTVQDPKAQVAAETKTGVQTPPANGAAPGTDAQSDAAKPGTSPAAGPPANDAAAALAAPLPSLLPMGTAPTKADPANPGASLAADLPAAVASTALAGPSSALPPMGTTPTKAPTGAAPQASAPVMPGTSSATASPTTPTPQDSPLPVGTDHSANSGTAADSGSASVRPGATSPLPAEPQATSLTGSDPGRPQASTQAALAELASQVRVGSRAPGNAAATNPVVTEAPAGARSLKVADAQGLSLGQVEAQDNPTQGPTPTEAGSSSSGAGDPSAAAAGSPGPESTLQLLEAPAAKSTLAPTSVAHALDGSDLAAAGLLPRAGETPTVSAAAAPLAPATQPSAPVLQVEGGLRWMLKGGAQEAQLQLHPDSLGQVTIHLKVVGSEVHARMWITEPGSVQAVQEGRPHLEMALKEQGLQLGSFDLQQGQQPFQEAPTAHPFREVSFQEAAPARQEAPVAPAPNVLNSHHVELFA